MMEADLTCYSAHCSFHKVAHISSHMCSKAIANQVNVPKRKLFFLLKRVIKERELKNVALSLQVYQQFSLSIITEAPQGSQA